MGEGKEEYMPLFLLDFPACTVAVWRNDIVKNYDPSMLKMIFSRLHRKYSVFPDPEF
jgi:hypothetical protein